MKRPENYSYLGDFPLSSDRLSELFFNEQNIIPYQLLLDIAKLEKSPHTLVVSDFDDTLFSREEQLKDPILSENRGEAGNRVIREQLGGYRAFVEKYYGKEGLTDEIVQMVAKNVSIILTAGIEEFQNLKIEKVGLEVVPRVIVPENSKKPFALLQYILSTGKIPKHIKIFDDRVKHLLEKGYMLAELLQTEISVFEVKLKGNEVDSMVEHSYG